MWHQISGSHCAQGNSETHISTKITNVKLFGPQRPAVMWGTAGTLQLNQKVKSTTYVNSSGLQVRKTTASYLGNPELRSKTFALKLSKDLAWYYRCEPCFNLALLPVLQTLQACVNMVTFGLPGKRSLTMHASVVPESKSVFHIVGVKKAYQIANRKAKC